MGNKMIEEIKGKKDITIGDAFKIVIANIVELIDTVNELVGAFNEIESFLEKKFDYKSERGEK